MNTRERVLKGPVYGCENKQCKKEVTYDCFDGLPFGKFKDGFFFCSQECEDVVNTEKRLKVTKEKK
jgi:hypothetical protein